MKITHICLVGPYTDGWNYQENLLSKYHKKDGYDVDVITSCFMWNRKGQLEKNNQKSYLDKLGVEIHRLPIDHNRGFNYRLKRFSGLYELLEEISPDVIFIHGCQFCDISTIVKYLKNNNRTVVYVDNHADFSNSATTWLSKNVLHKIIWRYYAKKIDPYVKKWYGVLPARVDFLSNVYGISTEKIEFLPMGADDDLINLFSNTEIRFEYRKKYCMSNDDVLIISGGKINEYRPEVLNLMAAVKNCGNNRVKLVIFGCVSDKLNKVFQDLLQCPNIHFVGWLEPKDTYAFISAADLVCFPGLHSVMWEQTVALGIPCIFRDIEGFHHVDLDGNAIFVKDTSEQELKRIILGLLDNPEKLNGLKSAALSEKRKMFLYSEIAKRAIQ